jgi:hypothetical protein
MTDRAQEPAARRRLPAAFATGAVVGTLGGLIGLGGAEFRLPLLIGLFRFAALEAVILNKAMSLVVVASALPFRAAAVPWTAIADHWRRLGDPPRDADALPGDCRAAGARDCAGYLVDRHSERKESAEELTRRVNQRSIYGSAAIRPASS